MSLKIVILGATGFVGRALVRRLQLDGHEITVLSRNLNAHLLRLLPPTVKQINADVYDLKKLQDAIQGNDAVINLVGILNEKGDNGRGFHHAHVELTQTLIQACKNTGVNRLLQMSSLNAGRGESYYLKSRGEAEQAVKQSGLAWTIFEPSVIFGIGDGLFTRFGKLLKLAPVMPLARADAKFAPVYIGDVVQAFRQALGDRKTIGEVYELYGGEIFTLKEIVRMSARQMGLKTLIIPLPDIAGRMQAMFFDFMPGKPFSSDNFRSLLTDSVGGVDGLYRLNIRPTRVQEILPDILGHGDDRQARYDRNRADR
ncbi:MAG: complex I NDUFA9 subunit family protein [Arenimonas sp.]